MVAVLHIYAHGIQGKDGVPAQVGGIVGSGQVEVSAAVLGLRAMLILEVEELQISLQDVPGVTLVGAAVGIQDVAEHPGHGVLLLPPGDELEGGGIGLGDHVGFVDAGKALDGGAFKAHALGESPFQLVGIWD